MRARLDKRCSKRAVGVVMTLGYDRLYNRCTHADPLLAVGRLAGRPGPRRRRSPVRYVRRPHADGDPWRALRRLFQQGLQHPAGQRTPGLQDLLKQLRQQRQQRLDRYDLGGALEDIKKKLAEVIQTEREGIKDRLAGTSAEQKLAELDKLPPDPGGQLPELQTYD